MRLWHNGSYGGAKNRQTSVPLSRTQQGRLSSFLSAQFDTLAKVGVALAKTGSYRLVRQANSGLSSVVSLPDALSGLASASVLPPK
jgi:hypothetical protein